MNYIITGGAGFIGSNFVEYLLRKNEGNNIHVVDKLTYAGILENLAPYLEEGKISFVKRNICSQYEAVDDVIVVNAGNVETKSIPVDIIVNFAGETHVDRSIEDAEDFFHTNIIGTYKILELCRKKDIPLLQMSTDEVYGDAEREQTGREYYELGDFIPEDYEGKMIPQTPGTLNPSSPYAVSKASADMLCLAYKRTYGLNIMIARSVNVYGERQHSEKFIPTVILKLLKDEAVPLYGDGKQRRTWIYVKDCCDAINFLIEKGRWGEIYNITTGEELRNIDVIMKIAQTLGLRAVVKYVQDRAGHDRRYLMTGDRLKELGWQYETKFEEGIKWTVEWYTKRESD